MRGFSKVLAVLLLGAGPGAAWADADHTQTLWTSWSNTTALSRDWSLVSDVQLRSNDDAEDLRNFIVRAGLSYALNPQLRMAAGYAYIDTYRPGSSTLTEHRSWQQLIASQRIGGCTFSERLRLEQRFIERAGAPDTYSDRLRLQGRVTMPLQDRDKPLERGAFAFLQDEVFFHLSHRQRLNGKLFDQNRLYAGLGWRFSPKLDVEAGYLNQLVLGRSVDTQNHALQLQISTKI